MNAICTGTRYGINPDDFTEGTDIHHDGPCPFHHIEVDRRSGTHPNAYIHRQTGSSTVRCGYPMRHWRDQPEGWDMGNATPDGHVTCPGCISR